MLLFLEKDATLARFLLAVSSVAYNLSSPLFSLAKNTGNTLVSIYTYSSYYFGNRTSSNKLNMNSTRQSTQNSWRRRSSREHWNRISIRVLSIHSVRPPSAPQLPSTFHPRTTKCSEQRAAGPGRTSACWSFLVCCYSELIALCCVCLSRSPSLGGMLSLFSTFALWATTLVASPNARVPLAINSRSRYIYCVRHEPI